MIEKPIIFSTEMVKAILEGRKTQTRRIMNPQPLFYTGRRYIVPDNAPKKWHDCDDIFAAGFCPYGQPGTVLWVRETWADLRGMGFGFPFAYKVDTPSGSEGDRCRIEFGVKWKPSIHMPRKAARLFLKVKDVRVERLQEIVSGKDVYREGCPESEKHNAFNWFMKLWNNINAKRGYGWETSPWVWVIEFEVVRR
ncbi:MAG: hypothetical protein FH756_01650 [Firmicutes bacterium]|nr:hypothetical protein [Bacillota bacterium]